SLIATGPADRLKPGEVVQLQVFFEPSPPAAPAPAPSAAPAPPPPAPATPPRPIGAFMASVVPGQARYDWTVKVAKPGEPPLSGTLFFYAIARGQKLTSPKLPCGDVKSPKLTDLKLVGAGGASTPHATAPEKITDAEKFCFAPGAEKVKIAYKVDDPAKALKKGTLGLIRAKDGAALWSRPLTPQELAHGDRTIEWDGAVPGSALLPGGFPTVEHSPYELKITAESSVQAKVDPTWTFFRVQLAELSIEKGDPWLVAGARDQGVVKSLKFIEVPKEGEVKVLLPSDCFKLTTDEMYDGSSFSQYASIWAEGPAIPLVAKLRVKSSGGAGVEAPAALGAVKVLWDWACASPLYEGMTDATKLFVSSAANYSVGGTSPRGLACHVDRGGKRGEGAKPVFPAQGGVAPGAEVPDGVFPWKVEPAKRRSSALSTAWAKGEHSGEAGVVFQPSRMAGDGYKLTVCAAAEGTDLGAIDVEGELKAPVSRTTATFRVWRELHVNSFWRKNDALEFFDLSPVIEMYRRSCIEIVEAPGARKTIAGDTFNAQLKAVLAQEPWYVQAAIDDLDQASYSTAIWFADYDVFKDAVAKKLSWGQGLAGWLRDNSLDTEKRYAAQCKVWASRMLTAMTNGLLSPGPGINICLMGDEVSNFESVRGSHLNGQAVDARLATRTRCVFLLFTTKSATFGHELGHQLFLPHAPSEGDGEGEDSVAAGGASRELHDAATAHCLMSYSHDRPEPCGLCNLRLRGWKHAGGALSNAAAANARA
ncbi:MAG TPA: hypothetical protein VHF22_08795, partial [Planctomycetota bacterium]|nr:hypothetical protein [Planctomycetota bacterium]